MRNAPFCNFQKKIWSRFTYCRLLLDCAWNEGSEHRTIKNSPSQAVCESCKHGGGTESSHCGLCTLPFRSILSCWHVAVWAYIERRTRCKRKESMMPCRLITWQADLVRTLGRSRHSVFAWLFSGYTVVHGSSHRSVLHRMFLCSMHGKLVVLQSCLDSWERGCVLAKSVRNKSSITGRFHYRSISESNLAIHNRLFVASDSMSHLSGSTGDGHQGE
jgi:hypothetical protein